MMSVVSCAKLGGGERRTAHRSQPQLRSASAGT
jgi:hypothetical protein